MHLQGYYFVFSWMDIVRFGYFMIPLSRYTSEIVLSVTHALNIMSECEFNNKLGTVLLLDTL